MQKLLAALAPILAKALFDYAVAWIKDPKNHDDVETAGRYLASHLADALPSLVDKATDAIPGTLDDQVLDGLARRLAPLLAGHLPDLGGLTDALAQLQALLKKLP